MPFAALHQLCLPMLGEIGALPEPQEQALKVAFGLAAGNAPDRFVVGLAVLGLLAEVAAKRPLVCLVDDAQWLDEASCHVLGFVARRLLAEAVVLLLAVRETGDERLFPGLKTLTLEGLADEDARSLLAAAMPGHLDEQVRDRIVAETRGNPLGLLELPRGMSPAELAGGFRLPHRHHSRAHRGVTTLRRVTGTPGADPATHAPRGGRPDRRCDAALACGADPRPRGERRPPPPSRNSCSRSALACGFRHPLVRSAGVRGRDAGGSPRRAPGARRGDRCPRAIPERRVWHLAAAATSDRTRMSRHELERTAETAQARAGLPAAAAFLQRAVDLDRRPGEARRPGAWPRPRRTCTPARSTPRAACWPRRRPSPSTTFNVPASSSSTDRSRRLRSPDATYRFDCSRPRGGSNPSMCGWRAIPIFRRGGPRLLAGQFAAPGGSLLEVSTAALSAPRPADPRPCDLLLDGLARVIAVGRAEAAPSLRLAVDLFLPIRSPPTIGSNGVVARRRPPSHSGTSTAGPN